MRYGPVPHPGTRAPSRSPHAMLPAFSYRSSRSRPSEGLDMRGASFVHMESVNLFFGILCLRLHAMLGWTPKRPFCAVHHKKRTWRPLRSTAAAPAASVIANKQLSMDYGPLRAL